jgi:SAM-dependent methyltransferase
MEDISQNKRHLLYQKSVQNPKREIEFYIKQFRNVFNKIPLKFREDFCGTGLLCCEWVKSNVLNTAIGIDYDLDTINFGIENNVNYLSSGSDRVKLIHQNVLDPFDNLEKFDIICSMNYSHFLLTKRKDLVKYFKNVKSNLNTKGMLLMDFFGGAHVYDYHTHNNLSEIYKYIGEQMNILNNITVISLNFKNDKNNFEPFFKYNFRVYTLIELKEALEDAGFNKFKIFIKDIDEEDRENNFIEYEDISFEGVYFPGTDRFNGYLISYFSN